jgi:hypothetical protein
MPSQPGYNLNRDVLQGELVAALKKAGVILPEPSRDAIVSFVLDRLSAQRERLAGIVDSLAGMYDELDQAKMDTLSRLIREHVVDADGNICLQDD